MRSIAGALMKNGGQTPTHALLPASPAIDAGSSFGLTRDQRGSRRPVDAPRTANSLNGDFADIGAYKTPITTAASVSISGRVTNTNERSIPKAFVYLTSRIGETRLFVTNPFDGFHFSEVSSGEFYTISVSAKRRHFQPQTFSVTDNLTDLNFTSER